MAYVRALIDKVNDSIAHTTFGRAFRLDGCGHEKQIRGSRFTTELRAGLTTFVTMAYIISVNAAIMKDSGGTCVCKDTLDLTCAKNPEYQACLVGVQRDMVTATAAIAGLGSCIFGFLTNLPVSLAPGMGLNAYFTYQVVGFHGTGKISYGTALAAVFVEGWIFVFLSLIGMRQWLVKLLPTSIKIASACGIGMFLAIIGLSYTAGIGAITGSYPAPLDLGGCPPEYLNEFGHCKSHKMQNPALWIGVFLGGLLTTILMAYKVKSAMIIGILCVSIVSWPRSTSFTYFPHTEDGDARFDFFKQVVGVHGIKHTLNAIDWNISANVGQFMLALITFLYVDILDCTATLFSMARFAGVVDPESGDFPRSTIAYCTDAVTISIGSLLGTSPVTTFIESGAGVAEGGRTGLTAITTGLCFLLSLFFAPIFASIPPWATGCTLIIIGSMMMRQVVSVNWKYIGDAVPAFVTLAFIPFSYSIAYGLLAGTLTYVTLNGVLYLIQLASRGRLLPADFEQKESWNYQSSLQIHWSTRLDKMKDFFHVDAAEITKPPVKTGRESESDKSAV